MDERKRTVLLGRGESGTETSSEKRETERKAERDGRQGERESWRDAEEKGLMRMKQGSGCMRRCIDDAREHSPGRCTLKVH